MLVRGGVPAAAAASGMTASSLLLFGTLLALPLLALPAILGGVAVDPHLTKAALAGRGAVRADGGAGRGVRRLGPAADRSPGRAAQAIRNRVRKGQRAAHRRCPSAC